MFPRREEGLGEGDIGKREFEGIIHFLKQPMKEKLKHMCGCFSKLGIFADFL
jgi:hypothetical protein